MAKNKITKRAEQGEVVRAGGHSFSDELAASICAMLAEGKSLRRVLKEPGMPAMSTVFVWLQNYPSFTEQYARAKEESADALADDIIDLAERVERGEVDPNAARVSLDAKKWSASKLKPKKYGDKVDLTTNGKDMPTPILGMLNITDEIKPPIIDL
jgi:hypothetical protein